MSKLAALRPTNEAEERERFLAALSAGERYEPQLRYAQPRRAAEIRSSCDKHFSDEYAEIAQRIMRGVIDAHGSEAAYCENVWGRTIERSEVDAACDAYLAQNGFDGEVDFIWSPHTLVTTCLGSKVHLVTRPRYYREARLASLLDHEVGTHFVRAHNHRKVFGRAKWASRTTGWLLSTEEGLATINTVRSYDDKAHAQPSPTQRARRSAARIDRVSACVAAAVGPRPPLPRVRARLAPLLQLAVARALGQFTRRRRRAAMDNVHAVQARARGHGRAGRVLQGPGEPARRGASAGGASRD